MKDLKIEVEEQWALRNYHSRETRFLLVMEMEHYSTIKISTMDQKNLSYLKDTLKYHGFGEKLFTELEANMKAVNKEFTLTISADMQKDNVSATLHFRKSNETEAYFFNKFDAVLIKPGIEPREQTFYIDKGKGFTMKEAYNYLDGRSVHKEFTNQEGEKYKAWRQLDLDYKNEKGQYEVKQYSERYGYDVREALSYYPIREFMKADDSLNLVKALERGNLQPVTMDHDGVKVELLISADPKNRSLNVHDIEGRLLSKSEKEELMLQPDVREQRIEYRAQLQQDAGKDSPKEVVKDVADVKDVAKNDIDAKEKVIEKTKDKSKVKEPAKETKLLEKKRTSNKKGMSMG